ncbi:MAG: thioesterase family protein [Acetobacteraceae bacterium]
MTNWIETYRGAVPPWQCDVTEHFTIAYYFDRVEEADANLAEALGFGTLTNRGDIPRRINARFVRELRAGAGFHIESAVLGAGAGLRLGHRVLDSTNGEAVTWFETHWDISAAPLTAAQRAMIQDRIAEWNGPDTEPRPEPASTDAFIPTARGRVKPADVDAAGNFSLGAMVHRFSNASGQLGSAIGMDAAFMQQQRRGFSTFELILQLSRALPLDAPYLVETGIGQFGNSSLRMIHRMTDPRSGTEVARLSQFGVALDLDARRPARWPDEIRRRAEALVVPVG